MNQKNKPQRILVIKTHALGDLLLVTPAIRALRKKYNDSFIALLTGEKSSLAVKNNPNIDEVITFDESIIFQKKMVKIIKLSRQIKRKKFDLALIFQASKGIQALAWLAGIPARYGFSNQKYEFFLTKKAAWDPHTDRYIADHFLDLVRLLGIEENDIHLDYFIDPAANQEAAQFLLTEWNLIAEKYPSLTKTDSKAIFQKIVIFFGGGRNPRDFVPQKRWATSNFIELMQELHKIYNCFFITIGSSEDGELLFQNAVKPDLPIINACGKGDISFAAALINQGELLITNDSAPLHIAAALDKPTISIFGPSYASTLAPRGKHHLVLCSNFECSPCYANEKFPGCTKSPSCLAYISVQSVINAVKDLNKIMP